MIQIGAIGRLATRFLAFVGVFPHEFLYPTPFKIFEFRELAGGIGMEPAQRWLDVGCGNGFFTLLLGGKCREVVGVDVSREYIRIANFFASVLVNKVRASFHCARLEELGFPPDSFDKVFSFCVIEHIDNYTEVLKEIHRLLKPGGELIFSADSLATIGDPVLLEKHRRDSEVVRYFEREELERLLRTVGFRDVRVKPIFGSPFARDLFSEGIRTRFVFGRVRPVFLYRRLRKEEERFGPAEKGLFLVARAEK